MHSARPQKYAASARSGALSTPCGGDGSPGTTAAAKRSWGVVRMAMQPANVSRPQDEVEATPAARPVAISAGAPASSVPRRPGGRDRGQNRTCKDHAVKSARRRYRRRRIGVGRCRRIGATGWGQTQNGTAPRPNASGPPCGWARVAREARSRQVRRVRSRDGAQSGARLLQPFAAPARSMVTTVAKR